MHLSSKQERENRQEIKKLKLNSNTPSTTAIPLLQDNELGRSDDEDRPIITLKLKQSKYKKGGKSEDRPKSFNQKDEIPSIIEDPVAKLTSLTETYSSKDKIKVGATSMKCLANGLSRNKRCKRKRNPKVVRKDKSTRHSISASSSSSTNSNSTGLTIKDLATPSAIDTEDVKQRKEISKNEHASEILLLQRTPPKKRGRKPDLFYSEDDSIEITGDQGADDSIIFINLEQSPIVTAKKQVSARKTKLSSSIASHYQERKQDVPSRKVGMFRNKTETKQGLKISNVTQSNDEHLAEASPCNAVESNGKKKKRGRRPKTSIKRLCLTEKAASQDYSTVLAKGAAEEDPKHSSLSCPGYSCAEILEPTAELSENVLQSITSESLVHTSKSKVTANLLNGRSMETVNETFESDGGSLPFNGFGSSKAERTPEVTEDDDGTPCGLDYVLVSSTVLQEEQEIFHNKNNCFRQKNTLISGQEHNEKQPKLKLKLVIRNKLEQHQQNASSQKPLAKNLKPNKNTLEGAIELKKRLIRQRRTAKREKKKKIALLNSHIKQTEKSVVPSKVGPKRRSSFADSFYSQAGTNGLRRNAAKVCLEKMVAKHDVLIDNEVGNKEVMVNNRDEDDISGKVDVPGHLMLKKPYAKILATNEVDSTDDEVTLNNYRKARPKSRVMNSNINVDKKYDSSEAGESSDSSERRRMSKRNASLCATVIMSLSNYGGGGRNLHSSHTNSDSGHSSPKRLRTMSSSSATPVLIDAHSDPPYGASTEQLAQSQPKSERLNVFETDDVDEMDIITDAGKKETTVFKNELEGMLNGDHDHARLGRKGAQALPERKYKKHFKHQTRTKIHNNPFVDSRECSLERAISASRENASADVSILQSNHCQYEAVSSSESSNSARKSFSGDANKAFWPNDCSRKDTRKKIPRCLTKADYHNSSDQHRVFFPREVRFHAIQQMEEGKTQAGIAKDLNCSISTVASWWHRRNSISAKSRQCKKSTPRPTTLKEQSSSGVSLSPSSYSSSERDAEVITPSDLVQSVLQKINKLDASVRPDWNKFYHKLTYKSVVQLSSGSF